MRDAVGYIKRCGAVERAAVDREVTVRGVGQNAWVFYKTQGSVESSVLVQDLGLSPRPAIPTVYFDPKSFCTFDLKSSQDIASATRI